MGPRAICVASAASLVTSTASASVSFAAVFEFEAIVATAATTVIITASAVEVKAARAAAIKATATREPVATTNASFYACVVARAIVWLKLEEMLAAPVPAP